MKVLDIACGSGGSAIGYAMAGCSVLGVDVAPMPRFPFGFLQCDAMDLDDRFLRFFDLVHASPPCQRFTALRHARGAKGDANPDLIAPLREKFCRAGVHYVIENVPGAAMRVDLALCGCMFGLRTYRLRWFEITGPLMLVEPVHRKHVAKTASKGRREAWASGMNISITGDVGTYLGPEAMGIDWMSGDELSQAIPPAYTKFIGEQLLAHLRQEAA